MPQVNFPQLRKEANEDIRATNSRPTKDPKDMTTPKKQRFQANGEFVIGFEQVLIMDVQSAGCNSNFRSPHSAQIIFTQASCRGHEEEWKGKEDIIYNVIYNIFGKDKTTRDPYASLLIIGRPEVFGVFAN